MPIGTAVHERTFALAESLNYREWSGYYAVSAYETHHEHEYNAIRNAAALIDVSPLFKYIVSGRDATKLVDRIITRDACKLAVGQVYYTPWCDERGKVIDDGTVTRTGEDSYRWTAADPSLRWLTQNAVGLHLTELLRQHFGADAERAAQSAEVARAVADFPENQQLPAAGQHLDGVGGMTTRGGGHRPVSSYRIVPSCRARSWWYR